MKKLSYLLSFCFTLVFAATHAQNCSADFQYSINGLTVDFTDSSWSNTRTHTYSWNFGDNSTSTAMNPSHTFAKGGVYNVCLTISDTSCTSTKCDSISVMSNSNPCSAFFSYWADTLNNVSFTSSISPALVGGYSYSWDFGDGNSDTLANPTHGYANSGAYGVTLTATSSTDTCTYYDTIYVNYCAASFTYSIGANGEVTFTNYTATSRYSTEYTWDFGDSSTSMVKHPTHTYAASGTYHVSLTSYDSLNNCTSTVTDSVVIVIKTVNCSASFTIEKDSSTQYNIILYNNSTNASSHSYSWDFGDGTTGSGRTPIHTYQSFGSYEVCLTITDSVLRCDTTVYCDTVGMDSLGNLKAGFGIEVRDGLTVGLEEEEDDFAAFKIFPNPAKNMINLDLRGRNDVLNIRIMDLSGRIVSERLNTLGGDLETFELSNYSKGIYFMMIDNGATQTVEKFIVAN